MQLAIRYHEDPSLSHICDAFTTYSNFIGRWFLCIARVISGKTVGFHSWASIPIELHQLYFNIIIYFLHTLVSSDGRAAAIANTNADMLIASMQVWALGTKRPKMFSTPLLHAGLIDTTVKFIQLLVAQLESIWDHHIVKPIGSAGPVTEVAAAVVHLDLAIDTPLWDTEYVLKNIDIIHQLACHHTGLAFIALSPRSAQ